MKSGGAGLVHPDTLNLKRNLCNGRSEHAEAAIHFNKVVVIAEVRR